MSESATLNKAVLSEGMQKEMAKAEASYATDGEAVASSIPLKEAERDRVKDEVKRKMAQLEEVDIYSGEADTIAKAFEDIFSRADANRQSTAELANNFTQRNFRGAQDKSSFKAVTDLAAALQKYDPRKFDLTEPEGFMRYVPMPGSAKRGIANYMRSFKEAQGQINSLMDGVDSVADDGVKAKEELKDFNAKLLKLAKELRVQYETFNEISTSVGQYLADLKERDPTKAQMVESELVYRITEARLDTLTTLLQAKNGSILATALMQTQDMIIVGAKRVSSSGRLILTINQTAAAAAGEQTGARELLQSANDTIGNMTESTAKLVLEHTKQMKALASSSLGPSEKLKAAFQAGFQALDELKNVQAEVTKKMESNIVNLEGIQKDAEARLSAHGQAVGAFQEAVVGGQALARVDQIASADALGPKADAPAPARGPKM